MEVKNVNESYASQIDWKITKMLELYSSAFYSCANSVADNNMVLGIGFILKM